MIKLKHLAFFAILILVWLAYPARAELTATSVRIAYNTTNVTTSSWTDVLDILPAQTLRVQVFDSSGQTMQLKFDYKGSLTYVIVPPGGADIPVKIARNSSVQVKSLTGTARKGELDINFLY